MYHLLNEASEKIPNFSGMKFTSYDLVDLGRCADKFSDTMSLCYGLDEVVKRLVKSVLHLQFIVYSINSENYV